jgi:hypothetical protein
MAMHQNLGQILYARMRLYRFPTAGWGFADSRAKVMN